MYEQMAHIIIAERQQHAERVNRRAWQSHRATRATGRIRLAAALRAVAARLVPAGDSPTKAMLARR